MKITAHDPAPDALLLCGVPLAAGFLPADGGLELIAPDGRCLPLWWEARAHWPDHSAKWLYLHARLSAVAEGAAPLVLELRPGGPSPPERLPPPGGAFELGPSRLQTTPSGWTFSWQGRRAVVAAGTLAAALSDAGSGAGVETEPLLTLAGAGDLELVEPSPIAPLLRLRSRGEGSLRFDHLIRLDPVRGTAHWQQRLSFAAAEPVRLRRLSAHLTFPDRGAAAPWQWPGLPQGHPAPRRLTVLRPGRFSLDGGAEQVGHPGARLEGGGVVVELEKGWQRAPFALAADGPTVALELYPAAAEPLTVHPGTSFRHSVRLGLSGVPAAPVRWSLEPEAACGSGAFGPLMPRSPVTRRRYPGYEQAIDACLHGGRLSALEKERGGSRGSAAGL
ncbi:MAG: hypothetical protein ABIL09_16940, partial [Gemmatimonadota bacterium]